MMKFTLACILVLVVATSTSMCWKHVTKKPMIDKSILDEADKASVLFQNSFKALETQKTIGSFKAYTEDALPFVKIFGSFISIFGKLIGGNELSQELAKYFSELNHRLDVIEWTMNEMMQKIALKFDTEDYKKEFDKIFVIQEAKRAYSDYPSSSTLNTLRDTCGGSKPFEVITLLHKMVVLEDFLESIFNVIHYSTKEWMKWSQHITSDFLQAMVIEQVCLGVQDKVIPTVEDMEHAANFSGVKFREVVNKLEEKARQIEHDWPDKQLETDIKQVMASMSASKWASEVADQIYAKLNETYDAHFGVTVHSLPLAITVRSLPEIKNFNSTRVKVVQEKWTAVVNWSPRMQERNASQVECAYKVMNEYNCKDDKVQETTIFDKKKKSLLDSYDGCFNSNNFDMVYLFQILYSWYYVYCNPGNCLENNIASHYDKETMFVHKDTTCYSKFYVPDKQKGSYVGGEQYGIYVMFGF